MEKYIVKQEDLIGDIENFPIEIVQRMIECQVEYGNVADVKAFQRCKLNGFSWDETKEGFKFWYSVINNGDFNLFFNKYPNKKNKENMRKKYPVIKCTKELWDEIKPIFEGWGVKSFKYVDDKWDKNPYLVSNFGNGVCVFLATLGNGFENESRYLVNTKEEFLTDVAKLLGKEYPIKEIKKEETKLENMEKIIIGGVEIKPGMIIYLDNADVNMSDFWIVFPMSNTLAIVHYGEKEWNYLSNVKKIVTTIRDINKNVGLAHGEILWGVPKKINITKQQIAEKFNCNVEQLEIVD